MFAPYHFYVYDNNHTWYCCLQTWREIKAKCHTLRRRFWWNLSPCDFFYTTRWVFSCKHWHYTSNHRLRMKHLSLSCTSAKTWSSPWKHYDGNSIEWLWCIYSSSSNPRISRFDPKFTHIRRSSLLFKKKRIWYWFCSPCTASCKSRVYRLTVCYCFWIIPQLWNSRNSYIETDSKVSTLYDCWIKSSTNTGSDICKVFQ